MVSAMLNVTVTHHDDFEQSSLIANTEAKCKLYPRVAASLTFEAPSELLLTSKPGGPGYTNKEG